MDKDDNERALQRHVEEGAIGTLVIIVLTIIGMFASALLHRWRGAG